MASKYETVECAKCNEFLQKHKHVECWECKDFKRYLYMSNNVLNGYCKNCGTKNGVSYNKNTYCNYCEHEFQNKLCCVPECKCVYCVHLDDRNNYHEAFDFMPYPTKTTTKMEQCVIHVHECVHCNKTYNSIDDAPYNKFCDECCNNGLRECVHCNKIYHSTNDIFGCKFCNECHNNGFKE